MTSAPPPVDRQAGYPRPCRPGCSRRQRPRRGPQLRGRRSNGAPAPPLWRSRSTPATRCCCADQRLLVSDSLLEGHEPFAPDVAECAGGGIADGLPRIAQTGGEEWHGGLTESAAASTARSRTRRSESANRSTITVAPTAAAMAGRPTAAAARTSGIGSWIPRMINGAGAPIQRVTRPHAPTRRVPTGNAPARQDRRHRRPGAFAPPTFAPRVWVDDSVADIKIQIAGAASRGPDVDAASLTMVEGRG